MKHRNIESIVLNVVLIIFCTFFIVDNQNLQNDVDKYKKLYNNAHETVQLQEQLYEELKSKYEGTVDQLRYAEARERAAKARASRSRGTRTAGSTSGLSQRSTSVGVPARADSFSGRLRDITMYCPTGNSTASGKTPRRGMVATISRSIPFGTHIQIQGLGEFVVEDRIGHGSEFDIFTPSCSEADRFGRQHHRVNILGA